MPAVGSQMNGLMNFARAHGFALLRLLWKAAVGPALCGVIFLSGCAALHPHHKAAKQSGEQAPAGPRRVGAVAMVNEQLHFVLVDVGMR